MGTAARSSTPLTMASGGSTASPPRFSSLPTAPSADAGTNTRSICSSISFSTGSSVTTQVWRTRADTVPTTRSPSQPWRATSKAAASSGTSLTPAGAATAARTPPSAAVAMCSPVSGTSSSRMGTLQGRFAPVIGLLLARSRRRGDQVGIGKADARLGEGCGLLAVQHFDRRAHVAPEVLGACGRGVGFGENIARQHGCKLLLAGRLDRLIVGGGAAVECLGNPAHVFRHGEITDTHFPEAMVHLPAEQVENPLPQGPNRCRFRPQAANEENEVEQDHVESALRCVGDPIIGVEGGPARLRHDRAIEGADGIDAGAALRPAEQARLLEHDLDGWAPVFRLREALAVFVASVNASAGGGKSGKIMLEQ